MRNGIPSCAACGARASGPFSTLPDSDLEQLDREKTFRQYKRGQVIFYEGNPAFAVYCVYSGRVKLYKANKRGDEQIIRLLGPGDIMGYQSLLANECYTATAEAVENTTACAVSRSSLLDLSRQSAEVALGLLDKLAQELRASEEQILALTQQSVRQRTARLLLFLLEGRGKKLKKGVRIKGPLQRIEMAQMIGTSPETLSRTLHYLARRGILHLTRSEIVVANPSALRLLINSCST